MMTTYQATSYVATFEVFEQAQPNPLLVVTEPITLRWTYNPDLWPMWALPVSDIQLSGGGQDYFSTTIVPAFDEVCVTYTGCMTGYGYSDDLAHDFYFVEFETVSETEIGLTLSLRDGTGVPVEDGALSSLGTYAQVPIPGGGLLLGSALLIAGLALWIGRVQA